jgi:hypothetical protein
MAAERCSAPPPPTHDDQGRRHGIAADEVPRLAPRLKPFLRRPSPGWADIVDAADWLRHELGVAKPLWGEACRVIGREGAALALAIVSTKEPGHFRTTAGGYFHGMVAKAKAGELHLERSLWALRRGVAAPAKIDSKARWRPGSRRGASGRAKPACPTTGLGRGPAAEISRQATAI